MIQEKRIEYVDGQYEFIYPSFKNFIESLEETKIKKILQRKINGETLEKIGKDYGVTRERIRQLIAKALKNCPKVNEDKYLYLFEKYDFSKEMMMNFFRSRSIGL